MGSRPFETWSSESGRRLGYWRREAFEKIWSAATAEAAGVCTPARLDEDSDEEVAGYAKQDDDNVDRDGDGVVGGGGG